MKINACAETQLILDLYIDKFFFLSSISFFYFCTVNCTVLYCNYIARCHNILDDRPVPDDLNNRGWLNTTFIISFVQYFNFVTIEPL